MMELWRITCGADSRKASMMLELKTSLWMINKVLKFDTRLVSSKNMAKKARMFLTYNGKNYAWNTSFWLIYYLEFNNSKLLKFPGKLRIRITKIFQMVG